MNADAAMVENEDDAESDWIDRAPELVEAARQGDGGALGALLEIFRPFLLQVASESLAPEFRPKAAASDIVQQSFLDAHQNFPAFRGSSQADVASWLKHILEHNCIDVTRRFRSLKREVRREVPLASGPLLEKLEAEPTSRPDVSLGEEEQVAFMERQLNEMPLEYRLVIKLRNEEKLPFLRIGKVLGRSEDAARKLWVRAVEYLRKTMELSPSGKRRTI